MVEYHVSTGPMEQDEHADEHVQGADDAISGTLPASITGDADTVDGKHANQIGGVWTHDGTETVTGVTSNTYTLAGTHDAVYVLFQVENTSTVGAQIDLYFNGETAGNYNHINTSGTETSGDTTIPQILHPTDGGHSVGHFWVDGRWTAYLRGGTTQRVGNNRTQGWHNNTVTSPLDTFTLESAESFDLSVDVFGRDLDAGGPP